jgi:membrane protein
MRNDKKSNDDKTRVDRNEADRPGYGRKKDWKEILINVKDKIQKNHISIVSAGIAFYLFLALFPALAALLSIYGLIMDPQQVQEQINQLSGILPEQGQQLISETLQSVAGQSNQALGWGVALSILMSLWSANQGTKALFEGVNIAYEEENRRSFLKETAISLLFTLAGIVLFIICISIIVAFPAFMGHLGLPDVLITVIDWARWLILGLMVVFAIAAIYKFAPPEIKPNFIWISVGAIMATLLWLISSVLFSFYVRNFGDFDETYGAVAAVIILMLWLFLSSFLILIGAEINAELEKQTSNDRTVGKPRPIRSNRS